LQNISLQQPISKEQIRACVMAQRILDRSFELNARDHFACPVIRTSSGRGAL
jgi:hypothetical protein